MPQILPIKELRNTNDISDRCHSQREPLFITKNGYGDLVVMSMETYEDMLATTEIDAAIRESETEIEHGEILDARETLKATRSKYFG